MPIAISFLNMYGDLVILQPVFFDAIPRKGDLVRIDGRPDVVVSKVVWAVKTWTATPGLDRVDVWLDTEINNIG